MSNQDPLSKQAAAPPDSEPPHAQEAPDAQAAPVEPRDELRCTLCGLRACWTS